MSSIEKRTRNGQVSWRAHYRTPGGQQRNRSFPRRVDAERFLTTIESSKLTGSYIDPALAKLSVGDWSARWLDGQAHLKPSTRERYAGILREHLNPRWGTTRLAAVTHAEIQTWVTQLMESREPATVRKVYGVMSLVLASA